MSRMFSLTLRSSRVENYHSVASRAPGSSSEAVWNAKIHLLTRGVLFFPSHYHSSQYCRRDKCLRNRITLWINYKQSSCSFLSVLPFYSWILVLISLVRRRRNAMKTREIVSAQSREKSIPSLASPSTSPCWVMETSFPWTGARHFGGECGLAIFICLLIWRPYVSHFKENPSACLFLLKRKFK